MLNRLFVMLFSLVVPVPSQAAEFIVADGLAVTPFAVDELSNPCSIDVDDRGRVWVGEAANYRKKIRPDGDRILILEDTDKDGRADLTKVFYQNADIDGVHGVCVLGNRAIVSAPDRILILTDTDGDDKADEKKLLFIGKVLHPVHGQHDHAIHAVMFGPDGRLYFNFGNFNAELRREDGSLVKDIYGLPVNNSRQPYQEGMVIRCEPDGSRVEVLGHNFRNNWEVTVDSFGSMWQSDNDNGSSSCRVNFVMEHGNYGYRDERTGADYRTKRTNLERTMQRQMWHQNDPGVVPNLLITGFGAPTGILLYEGDLLPKLFHGQMIHAEPGRNSVWAFPAVRDGAGYSAEIVNVARSEADREYRPCDVSVAPDGSLFIADWYDPVDCCHRTLNDAGRLFRVAPQGHVFSHPKYKYDSPADAVSALRSPNVAARYKAWVALRRMGAAARPAIEKIVQHLNPRFRARGLWVLAEIAKTPGVAIEIAMRDESDDVRALALRIARRHRISVEPVVRRLVNDISALVHRECAVSLHRLESADVAELWSELAMQYDGKDRWYLEALGIGEVGNETECLRAWRKRIGKKWKAAGNRDIVWRSRAPEAVTLLAELLLDSDVPVTEHARLLRALDFHDGQHKQIALTSLLMSDPKRNPVVWLEAFQRVSPEFLEAHPDISERAGSVLLSSKGTVTFVDLVARFKRLDMVSHLMDMAAKAPESDAGIRAVAQIIAFEDWDPMWKALADPTRSEPFITALGYVNSVHAKNYLTGVVTNESQPEAIRLLAISAMGNSGLQAQELRRLVEQKKLPQEFMAPAIRALTLSPNPDTRMFAASQQHLIISANDRWTLEKLLAGQPDPTQGFAAFQKGGCIKCHKIGDQGREFGPDLSAIGKKLTAKQLFSAILKPSETISLGYESVSVLTDDGKLQSGFVVSETKDTLTLRVPGGLTSEIPKTTIEFRKRSNVSLMPKGIDAILLPQEIVDVVGWLRTQRVEKPDVPQQ
ncbi:MAG: PQQ-dependent sugar dehydrogenase [Fuerstiella sp.]|nr:PQQ-dependent sugar dehydrogenase [Fuerstiella sp.]